MTGTETTGQGTIRLELDSPPLEARLRYFPGSGEKPWTEQRILSLLVENRISEMADPLAVRSFLREVVANPESAHEAAVARGVPPVPGVPERVQWRELPVPPELQEVSRNASSRAGSPDLVRERVEKVKVEKQVARKGLLALVHGKEETVVVTERRTVTERVAVDPTVLFLGFIRAGETAADVKPPDPGTPGTGVNGTAIPASMPASEEIHLGSGLERHGLEVRAGQTGFLRRGLGWADLIPFRESTWSLSFDPTRSSCDLSLVPGDDRSRFPTGDEILREAERQGIDLEALLSAEEIGLILEEADRSGAPVERISVSREQDAFFSIDVREDKLTACLTVVKGRGSRKPLSLKELGEAIRASGLKRIDLEKVRAEILSFYRSPKPELRDYPLAEGKPPEQEADRELVWSVEFLGREEMHQALPSDGGAQTGESAPASLADFPLSRIERIALVRKDQKIATVSVPPRAAAGVDVYGNTIPPVSGTEPELRLFEGVVRRQNGILAVADGVLDIAGIDGATCFRIRTHRDGQVSVTISPDRMQAFLSLRRHDGTGKPVGIEDITAALQAKGVIFGIRSEALLPALERLGESEIVEQVPIAEGTPARNGSSGTLKFAVQLPQGSPVAITAGGRADFRNRTDVITVKTGTLIAEITPPQDTPRDGRDVIGTVLAARRSQQPEVRLGRYVRKETGEDGSVRIFAEHNGEVVYEKGLLEIRNVRSISGSVDFHSGNIRFPGTVLVSGSVLSGFHVLSGGDIQIGEVVQASLLSSEGNIRIAHGIKGGGKGLLRTKGDIEVGFAEQSTLLAVGDIRIRSACMLCQVKCNGLLALGTDRGTIVGGTIRARKGVEAHTLGSEAGVPTRISFGQDYLVADQIDLETKEIEKLQKTIAEIDTRLRRMAVTGSRDEVERLRGEKLTAMKTLEKRSVRIFSLRERFEEHYPSEVRIHGTIHAGVVFESHGRTLEIRDPKKKIRIVFNPETGRLEDKPLD